MFTKKPSPPPAAPARPTAPAAAPQPAGPRPAGWPMQVLTLDYFITGYLAPVEMPLAGFLNVPTQATVTLTGAQVQALGPQAAVANASPAEVTLPKSSIVAFIPRDEAGMRAAALQMPNVPQRAVMYAGPFVISAAFMLAGEMPVRNLFSAGAGGSMLAVTQAQVACQIPGTRFAPLPAQILIVNKALVQLYHPA